MGSRFYNAAALVEQLQSSRMQNSPVVLTLPGTWSCRAELMASLEDHAPGHRLVKNKLVDQLTQEAVSVSFRKGRSRKVVTDFRWSGLHWQDTTDMQAIERHASYVVLKGMGGSVERMSHLMSVASAVIRAGALGVHVDYVGIAHAPSAWLELCQDGLEGIHRAFVVTVDGPVGGAHSCGMHNFGLKEVCAPSSVPDRATVVGLITRHLLVKGACITGGQTISIGTQSIRYRFCDVRTVEAPDGTLIQHHVGAWKLERVDGMHRRST